MGVSVRRQSRDGVWYVHLRYKGQRAAQRFDNEGDARAVAAAVNHAMALGQFDIAAMKARKESAPVVDAQTLEDFYRDIVSPMWTASLSGETFKRYDGCFRIHITPAIGSLVVAELSRQRIKDFVVTLLKKDARKRTHGQERQAAEQDRRLSKDSIRNIVAALRAALNEAVDRHLLAGNPATRLGKLYSGANQVREEVDPFTAEEIPLLLEAALNHYTFNDYVGTLTAFHTGMRAGEIAGLEWSDIDFRNRFIVVRKQLKDGVRARTKQKKIRKVDISDVLLEAMQSLKKRRQEEYLGRAKNEVPSWVFLSHGLRQKKGKRAEGQPLDMANWRNRVFWKLCDKAKVRRRRLHDTRHTFASILLMAGESPVYVKEQLGHSSIKMTVDIYGHFIPGANRQAVNRLPSLTPTAAQDLAKKAAGQ